MSTAKQHRKWFEKYPKLFEKQMEILKSVGFQLDEKTLQEQGLVKCSGYSKVDQTRQLIVVFPDAFPSSAPKINDIPPSKLLVRHHRLDTRQLCLFGFNESRWAATLSVADALAEAERLISEYKDGNSKVENEPPEPISRVLPYQQAAMLVPPPISTFDGFSELKSKTGTFRGKFLHQENPKLKTVGRGIILEANFGGNKRNCTSPFSEYFKNVGTEIQGEWFYLPASVTPENFSDLLKQCFQQSKAFKRADFFWLGLIFKEEGTALGQPRFTWLIVRANSKGQFHLIRTFPYIQLDRYVRIPGLDGLENKRVLLAGCGSVGSKIAAQLAASGVSRFRLVDNDFYEPNNAVRHENGVEFFGFPKEQALLQRLISLNPAVANNSKCLSYQIGGINAPAHEELFYSLLDDADIIVETTGIHSVTRFLNELVFELGIPMLMASVTNGAWGGDILRVIPGKTPCFLCWLDQYYHDGPPSAAVSVGEVFAPGCDQPTFTGTSYDIGHVASLAASICVETLLPEVGKVEASNNYIRWSCKDKNGTPVHLVEKLTTNKNQECWCCDPGNPV